ncbi:flagellin, partial [Aliarcobacter butzleri]
TAASAGLTFQVGESTAELIKTKTNQANVIGLSIDTLKGNVSAGAKYTNENGTVTGTAYTKVKTTAGQKDNEEAKTKMDG